MYCRAETSAVCGRCHASYQPLEVRQVHFFNPWSPLIPKQTLDVWVYLICCVYNAHVHTLHICIQNLQA